MRQLQRGGGGGGGGRGPADLKYLDWYYRYSDILITNSKTVKYSWHVERYNPKKYIPNMIGVCAF